MKLSDSVKILKSVGQARLALLHNMGIFTIEDLLEYFPRDYLDRSHISKIGELADGQMATIMVYMASQPQALYRNGKNITKIGFSDGTGRIDISWFNQPYMRGNFRDDTEYYISGKVKRALGIFTIEHPEVESVSKNVPRGTFLDSGENLSAGRIVPVYPLTAGISQKILRGLIKQAMDGTGDQIADFMPRSIVDGHDLCNRNFAIRNIHYPECGEAYFVARRRLVFEELFLMQAALVSAKGYLAAAKGRIFKDLDIAQMLDVLPYNLTDDQSKVVEEICGDLQSGYAANRLLQGDVGSGKTAVAMIMCYIAVKNGVQAALMAPTETLAVQHYQSFVEIFSKFGMSIGLLVGSVKKKADIKQRLARGDIDIVIGTHALIQDNVEFADLGLVITDEQHRFGVRQRSKLNKKGQQNHVLVMTATPIPRSLAMVLYGDMDISTINQLPPGRQKIDTFCVTRAYHTRIFKFIRDEIEKGNQAYIICPLIEESEHESRKAVNSVLKFAEELKNGIFVDIPLQILHGRMKPEEKQQIMQSFSAGDTKILVSTTVIEVGINVPNATVILIENAEHFGLSQLHQLRGRVGRSDKKSYCILVTDSKNEITKKRMDAMVGTNDGFELSEMDLQLRGPGEFFGTMQHGIPQMRLANLYKDMEVLAETRRAITEIFSGGDKMFHVEHEPLKNKIQSILGNIEKISL